jgi:hypothetical protein
MRSPLDRSYAQMLRTDRVLTFESQAARASFWARIQRENAAQLEQTYSDNVAAISQGFPHDQTQFAGANIHLATLDSVPAPSQPSMQGQATLAGLGEGGIAPPPPAV